MRNYTIYHLHTEYSNITTNIDSVTKPIDYIKKAQELGMKAIAFSEHGNISNWVEKKFLAEEYGLKYIHGVEAYLTENSLDGKKTRDNYHCGLYAKNYDGVIELNKLLSNASNRNDNHFHYTPRITLEELYNTSDNIIITTACVGGLLARASELTREKFIKFLIENKERCFLEVQHHLDETQVRYNSYLLDLSRRTGLRLIAGTDTHALDEKHAKGRKILQRSKKIVFEDEDGWDITLKTYDELFKLYQEQGIFTDYEIEEFLENTNVLASMVEEFTIDTNFKYPKLVQNSLEVLKEKIYNGIKTKGIDKYENYESEYLPRIRYELDTYETQGAIDYLLLDEDIKTHAKKNKIFHGPSRGSVSGSIVAYLIGLTEIDSIKENLNFERFMNKERISLADIDTDWPPTKREFVKNYVFNKPGLYCAEIITFNTVALKGSIRDCGRALDIPLEIINEICSNIESSEMMYREIYKELFEYVDIINGTIVSCGVHPCGSIVSPIPLDESIGVLTLSTSEHPVSSLSKNFVEKLNFVKLDILGLDNIEIINKTCELAGIERLTPENVPDEEQVWKSIRENTLGIFQWESDLATKYLEMLFSDETIEKIKKVIPNFKYIDLFSAGNGAIRPAGASYRDELANGIIRDNGHPALNEFLAPTLGYLVYQEQIIEFLNKFCKFSMGEADMVRRAFAKKTGTEKYIPKIKIGFCETMFEKYGVHEEESLTLIENFLQVIIDASSYLFSVNHSQAYSYIGYICGYLRFHYPLEFFTVLLNQIGNDTEKASKVMKYIKEYNIEVEQPTYGKSRAEYFCDKENKVIYKGIESIKYLNYDVAENLFNLSNKSNYNDFIELYDSLNGINSRQLDVLIKIGYFRNFGSVKKLLIITDLFEKFKKKTYKKSDFNEDQINILRMFCSKETDKQFSGLDKVGIIRYLSERISNDEFPINVLAAYQAEFIGDISITDPTLDNRCCIVMNVDTKYTPALRLYRLNNGDIIDVKVYKKDYIEKPLVNFDMIYVATCDKKNKKRKTPDGKWITLDDYNFYITYYKI